MNYYTVYLRKTEQIVASGTARECTKTLGFCNVASFYSVVSKSTHGKAHRYDVVIDRGDSDEDEEWRSA